MLLVMGVEKGPTVIKNQHQYRVTKAQLNRLEKALERGKSAKTSLQPRLHKAMIAGMQAQVAELRQELDEYDSLRNQEIIIAESFEELPLLLIRARIAHGLTQEQLAKRVKLKQQQIQRYESTNYRRVSLGRLLTIAAALDMELEKCEARLTHRASS